MRQAFLVLLRQTLILLPGLPSLTGFFFLFATGGLTTTMLIVELSS